MGINAANGGNFHVSLFVSPKKGEDTKEFSHIYWGISRLWYVADFTDLDKEIPAINYAQEKFLKPLQATFKNVYGNIDGQKLYEYAVNEYRLDNVKEHINNKIIYLNGIEIKNFNEKGLKVDFVTGIKSR
jgi:hypothetical protein